MSENSDDTGNTGDAEDQHQQDQKQTTYTQDDFNALDAKLRKEYSAKFNAMKKKADAWDQYEQSKKTEEQKAADEYQKLKAEHDALKGSVELEKARIKSGRKHNIPEADWDRLRGSTPEEVEQDAKEWAKERGLDKVGGRTPPGNANPARNPFNQAFLDATGRGGR